MVIIFRPNFFGPFFCGIQNINLLIIRGSPTISVKDFTGLLSYNYHSTYHKYLKDCSAQT
ncbi:MAG: hypothetical protein AMR96_04185 [Candidatus Adiutrix intracellularis]|nr:MAG: hypothetical protein AMR96_04185 [Candidatus Adiutrix intracellularis]